MMWWNHGNFGAGGWLAMSVMMLILAVVVVVVIGWLVRRPREGTGPHRAMSPVAGTGEDAP